jgi:hypothetical protein
MTFVKQYLDNGHTLVTDNWYTSPHLYDLLHKRKTNAFGTVRKNRKDMPMIDGKLLQGEFDFRSVILNLCSAALLCAVKFKKCAAKFLSIYRSVKIFSTYRTFFI